MTRRPFGSVRHELGEVDSTQEIARRLADAGAPEGTVVVAEHQRAGRGRGGRAWLDRPGENLLFSLVLRPALNAAATPQLALLAAVAVAEAIENATALAPAIKWPNDVLLEGRKVAGILAEAASFGDASTHVILGIGLNVNQRDFPPDLAPRVTSLAQRIGHAVDRRRLLELLLERLERWYDAYLARGFTAIGPEWSRRAVTPGQTVTTGRLRGTALALDRDGALLVRDGSGRTHRVVAGEVVDAAGP
jgi:BirA family biotin operon repressor/biotin-[acetyl-CoA-carboxylase] ligase